MIRKRLYANQELGEAMRDVDNALDDLAAQSMKRLYEDVHTEPMYLGNLTAEPFMLFLKARDMSNLEDPLPHDTEPSFVWEGNKNRVRIDAVEGLTVGTKYRYKFLVVK